MSRKESKEIKNRKIIILKNRKTPQQPTHLDININYFGDFEKNFGMFSQKLSTLQNTVNIQNNQKSRSPFHNPLLSSINIHTEQNRKTGYEMNFKEIHFAKRKAHNMKRKQFNFLSENEEELLCNAILKRKTIFPKLFHVSSQQNSTSTGKTEEFNQKRKKPEKKHNVTSNETYLSLFNKIKIKRNNATKKLLGNILTVQKLPFAFKQQKHKKQMTFDETKINSFQITYTNNYKKSQHIEKIITYNEPKKFERQEHLANEVLEYEPIKSFFHHKLRNVSM